MQRFRRHGAYSTWRYALIRLEEVSFDWRYGVKTHRTVLDSSCADMDGYGYWPAPSAEIREVLNRVVNKTGQDVFIDFGSGLARVVMLAAQHPFKRVIGIERNSALHIIAKENIRKVSNKLLCKNIELVEGDARYFEIPKDLNVLYFNEPFGEDVLKDVLNNIYNSLLSHPREITLIYRFPRTFDKVLPKVPWLEQTADFKVVFRHVICKSRLEMFRKERLLAAGI